MARPGAMWGRLQSLRQAYSSTPPVPASAGDPDFRFAFGGAPISFILGFRFTGSAFSGISGSAREGSGVLASSSLSLQASQAGCHVPMD